MYCLFFFKQKTAYEMRISDWSSDVCSSDLTVMQSPICTLLDIEFPLLAFSHCRDVVVAVSKAGGMGVFGAAALPPERLEEELAWVDEQIGGKHYGVALIVPNSFTCQGGAPAARTPKHPTTPPPLKHE